MRRDESDVQKVVGVVSSMINPFEEHDDLMSIASGVTASTDVVDDLMKAKMVGETEISSAR